MGSTISTDRRNERRGKKEVGLGLSGFARRFFLSNGSGKVAPGRATVPWLSRTGPRVHVHVVYASKGYSLLTPHLAEGSLSFRPVDRAIRFFLFATVWRAVLHIGGPGNVEV